MKGYQFQYTKTWDTLIVVLLALATYVATVFVGISNKLNIILTIVVSFGLAFLLFQLFKGKVVRACTAKLDDTSVVFEFQNETKTFNFSDLTSYKSYDGRSGLILYLNSNIENFKIIANNNFCKTDNFKLFCKDTIIQLDKYRETHSSIIKKYSRYQLT